METIVVLSVLSITLILLFGSYSYILKKSRVRKTFDTTEMIYANYNVNEYIKNNYGTLNSFFSSRTYNSSGVEYKVWDLTQSSTPTVLKRLKNIFDVEKLYILNPKKVIEASENEATVKNKLLNKFDATTVDYINHLGKGVNRDIFIVKYKKNYSDGSYEIFHAYMEVE